MQTLRGTVMEASSSASFQFGDDLLIHYAKENNLAKKITMLFQMHKDDSSFVHHLKKYQIELKVCGKEAGIN